MVTDPDQLHALLTLQSAEVDVGWREIVQALVIASKIIVLVRSRRRRARDHREDSSFSSRIRLFNERCHRSIFPWVMGW